LEPAILSLGTALPQFSMSQIEIADKLSHFMHLEDQEAWYLEKIFKNSAITKRFSVLPDLIHSCTTKTMHDGFLGMSERNNIYKREAPLLAEKSAREALKNWKKPLTDITHVISVSCTGVITPGIEFLLAKSLGLRSDVSLLGINFMGCHGAFKSLKVATKIAKENPKNRILLVCTELCSLHFKPRGDIESIVIQSLFADGSAALVMGCEPSESEKIIFKVLEERSVAIHDTLDDMTWDAGDEGFHMTLSQRVPTLIGMHIESFVHNLLGKDKNLQTYEWAIHPGGKLIIESVEKALSLDKSTTTSTWNVLSTCGNISSATFLHVLKDIQNRKIDKEKVVGLGFGPGLSVEGLVLEALKEK
jgi:predicted naringenin-chalcone synthase